MTKLEHRVYFVYLFIFTVPLDITLIVSYAKTKDFENCWIPKSRALVTSAGFLLTFAFLLNLVCGTFIATRWIKRLANNLALVSNILIFLSFPYLLLNTIFTPHCINIYSLITLWLVFGGVNVLFYLIVLLLCLAACVIPIIYYYEKKKME